VVGVGDVRAQASLAVANLGIALAAAGATLADVLKTTVFVASTQQADLVAAWEVVEAAFGEHDALSTLLGVAVLGYNDQLVEIEAVAAIAGQSAGFPSSHDTDRDPVEQWTLLVPRRGPTAAAGPAAAPARPPQPRLR
jgi:uncharacterized membrane protein